MKMTFGCRRGGSCLVVLIILALVGALILVVVRLAAVEKEREDEKRAAEAKPVEKTPRQLQHERINEMLSDEAPDLGVDPSKALVDGNINTMKSVRDKAKQQQATVKSRLRNAEESLSRLRLEQKSLERKWAALKVEFDKFPDDENVALEFGECDEAIEKKKVEILQAQSDVKVLKDYDYGMGREVSMLSAAIRRCEADGRIIATATEYEALKKELSEAHGAMVAISEMRRNVDDKNMDVSTRVSGEKARLRERVMKHRREQSQE